jgi:hypothetical protein
MKARYFNIPHIDLFVVAFVITPVSVLNSFRLQTANNFRSAREVYGEII